VIVCRSAAELEKMRAAGRLVGEVLTALTPRVVPGVTTAELDEVAEKMIRKLRAGQMPPPGSRRPDEAALARLADALEAQADAHAADAPPGRRTFQRLNRAEYARSIHDLLALRPGAKTAEYIDYVLTRITVVGAIYLAAVCVLPELLISYAAVPFYFGGTSLLIAVSVTMDTVAQVQSHLLAHQYEGLIKKAKLRGATRR